MRSEGKARAAAAAVLKGDDLWKLEAEGLVVVDAKYLAEMRSAIEVAYGLSFELLKEAEARARELGRRR